MGGANASLSQFSKDSFVRSYLYWGEHSRKCVRPAALQRKVRRDDKLGTSSCSAGSHQGCTATACTDIRSAAKQCVAALPGKSGLQSHSRDNHQSEPTRRTASVASVQSKPQCNRSGECPDESRDTGDRKDFADAARESLRGQNHDSPISGLNDCGPTISRC